MSGFDINRSRVKDSKLNAFLESPVDDDLNTVPGVGKVSVEKLAVHNIGTTHQLIGCYMRVCGEGMTSHDRANAFWFYLQAMDMPAGTRSTVVHAIAEKVNFMIPGMFVRDDVGSDSDSSDGAVLTNVEKMYHAILENEYTEGLVEFTCYTTSSFMTISLAAHEGVGECTLLDNNLLFLDDKLVVSESCLLHYFSNRDMPMPDYEVINIFK